MEIYNYWLLSPEKQAEVYSKVKPVNFHGLTPLQVRELIMWDPFRLTKNALHDNLKCDDPIWKAAV